MIWAAAAGANARNAESVIACCTDDEGVFAEVFLIREERCHPFIRDIIGDETAFGEAEGHFFVLYSKNIDRRLSTHDLEETVFHETVHATLEADHATSAAWLKAQKSDSGFITNYAARHPQKEDLPESALFAYAITKYPDRLPKKVASAVRKTMPNRLEYLRELFESMEAGRGEKESKQGVRKGVSEESGQERILAISIFSFRIARSPCPIRSSIIFAGRLT